MKPCVHTEPNVHAVFNSFHKLLSACIFIFSPVTVNLELMFEEDGDQNSIFRFQAEKLLRSSMHIEVNCQGQ